MTINFERDKLEQSKELFKRYCQKEVNDGLYILGHKEYLNILLNYVGMLKNYTKDNSLEISEIKNKIDSLVKDINNLTKKETNE